MMQLENEVAGGFEETQWADGFLKVVILRSLDMGGEVPRMSGEGVWVCVRK